MAAIHRTCKTVGWRQASAVIALGLVTACGPSQDSPAAAVRRAAKADAATGYAPPPTATAARQFGAGRVVLAGSATPGAKVRLASPDGLAQYADADPQGVWRFVLPASAGVRLFGLSAEKGGGAVQAEGYLAFAPNSAAAQLRSGAGAVSLDPPLRSVRILAADFDRKGGVVISGDAPAGAVVTVSIDGRQRGQTTGDAAGRFTLALDAPLAMGAHTVAASAGGGRTDAPLTISAATPLGADPFRAAPTTGGWRVDWLTPGGGVQSTILYDRVG